MPDLTIPVPPASLDAMQRELLDGTVHLDPHPSQRDTLRTKDIQDPAQAQQFMRTQVAKHLEHYFASNGQPKLAAKLTTDDTVPSSTVSPARIEELRTSPNRRMRGVRP